MKETSAVGSCEQLLQAMVGFDTVNGQISGVADAELELSKYLEAQAQSMGLATERRPVSGKGFNLLVTLETTPGAPWLLFESHLDTVSVEGMSIDPFAGHIKNGRLYGRGACDTKGSGAAMLWALHRYHQHPKQPNNIAIAFTLAEEVGKAGALALAEQLPKLAWQPKGVIVGEPTKLRLVTAHTGVVRWDIRTEGIAAHSSDPSRGRSAITMMVKVIEALERHYIANLTASHPLIGKSQCSINLIRGGTQINIIPQSCEIRVDRRLVPGERAEDVLPAVEEVLGALRAEHRELVVTQETPFIDPPLDPDSSGPIAAFAQRVFKAMGYPAEVCGEAYGTDASTYTQAGAPSLVLGPGDIAQAHTHDEWIELDQLNRAVEVYFNLMCEPWE